MKNLFGRPEPEPGKAKRFVWKALPDGSLTPAELRQDTSLADKLVEECSVGCDRMALSTDDQRLVLATRQRLSLAETQGMEDTIRQGSFALRYGLFLMPTYPVVVLKSYIFDKPGNPFWLESFLCIEREADKRLIEYLAAPDHAYRMGFHFYGENGSPIFRCGYGGIRGERNAVTGMEEMIGKASDTLDRMLVRRRDFAAAVERVLGENYEGIPAASLTTLFDA